MVKLGSKVRDTITGFEGIVTGRHEYLYGCVRLSVSPSVLHEGKPVEIQIFDEGQVELATETRRAPVAATGGPRDAPPTRSTPKR
ncbi:MAG: hypothetical protein PHS14_20920 [Elusimicrobia bacterium]|nr:hypothetical protein [Elusimicrobiota bacterium]